MIKLKRFGFGFIAAVFAVGAAEAADLPTKARPVQFVKVCSLYGPGFYYIPGTDMCLKVGGYVRQEITYARGTNSAISFGAFSSSMGTRNENNTLIRSRGYITADARNQTEYGTVRSYIAVGLKFDTPSTGAFDANRAFIQFAGFTFGVAYSFWDFYGTHGSHHYWYTFPNQDTYDGGFALLGYTARFGGGLSASMSLEGSHATAVTNTSITTPTSWVPGSAPAGAMRGFNVPDLVANVNLEQSWGAAQIMGALHDVGGTYYGTTAAGSTTALGNPDDKVGWAIGAGLKLNTPMIGPRDYIDMEVNYTQGALGYVYTANKAGAFPSLSFARYKGDTVGYGWVTDGVYSGTAAGSPTATGINLTTAWGINAAYEHYWNAHWQTSLYGFYAATRYNGQANAALCAGEIANGVTTAAQPCNNNYNQWGIGSRVQWNLEKAFFIGLDVLYHKFETASAGQTTGVLAPGGALPTQVYKVANQDVLEFRMRVQRDFMP